MQSIGTKAWDLTPPTLALWIWPMEEITPWVAAELAPTLLTLRKELVYDLEGERIVIAKELLIFSLFAFDYQGVHSGIKCAWLQCKFLNKGVATLLQSHQFVFVVKATMEKEATEYRTKQKFYWISKIVTLKIYFNKYNLILYNLKRLQENLWGVWW